MYAKREGGKPVLSSSNSTLDVNKFDRMKQNIFVLNGRKCWFFVLFTLCTFDSPVHDSNKTVSSYLMFREISKEDFDMDISNMQQELDNLKAS